MIFGLYTKTHFFYHMKIWPCFSLKLFSCLLLLPFLYQKRSWKTSHPSPCFLNYNSFSPVSTLPSISTTSILVLSRVSLSVSFCYFSLWFSQFCPQAFSILEKKNGCTSSYLTAHRKSKFFARRSLEIMRKTLCL